MITFFLFSLSINSRGKLRDVSICFSLNESSGRALIMICLLIGIVIFSASTYVLSPGRQAIITQFGKPVGNPVTESKTILVPDPPVP